MNTIDVSGEKFDFVDCCEGNMSFDTFAENEKFIIKAWRVILLKELGIQEKDVCIAAMSELEFDNVMYIHIYYGIYDETGKEFRKNFNGDSTNMYFSLGKKEHLDECTEYVIGGFLGRYIGYAEITIYCKGGVSLTYDENAFIHPIETIFHPEKYELP